MSMSVCQLCKQPIWSFICPQCLAMDIRKWLPNKFREAFRQFNSGFLGSFSATIDMDGLRCLKCRKVRLANICPHCYISEVYDWLREMEPRLAETLFRMLPIKQGLEVTGNGLKWTSGPMPISRTKESLVDEGTCELCERYSDFLVNADGVWLCRDCEKLE